jgi:uncharacterized repeat protein (TIGR01451 family)
MDVFHGKDIKVLFQTSNTANTATSRKFFMTHHSSLRFHAWFLAAALLAAPFVRLPADGVAPPVPPAPGIPPPPAVPAPRFNSDLYRVEKQVVSSSGRVGEEAVYSIRVDARDDIEQVRLLEILPPGLEYITAEPAPNEVVNGAYLWAWEGMKRDTSREVRLRVRPADGGWFVTTTKVAVVPVVALPLFAGRPKLQLEKTGPSAAELDSNINFQLIVTNIGTAAAENVRVSDTLPAGLYGADRAGNVVNFHIDRLGAGERRVFDVPAKAAVKGEWDNHANVFFEQEIQANATAHVSVVESKIALAKSGPPRAYTFTEAGYTITVRNEGDTVLENIQLADEVVDGLRFVEASDGGQFHRGKVTWTIPRLAQGETASRTVRLAGQRIYTSTAEAVATLVTGKQAKASATTVWEGAPGVLTEVMEDVDPVRIGKNVVYTVRVTNQSPLTVITGDVVFRLTDELRPLDVTKRTGAVIEGQSIIAKGVQIKPKGAYMFKVTSEAVKPGMAWARLEFSADFLQRPSVKEESTNVY